MKLSKLIYSKLICISIILSIFSWSVYLNSTSYKIITLIPSYAKKIVYTLNNIKINTFSTNYSSYINNINISIFILNMLLYILLGFIIASIICFIIKKIYRNND